MTHWTVADHNVSPLVLRSDVLELFRVVFCVLTSAMQDEPANKTYFMDEVRSFGVSVWLHLLSS